MGTTTGGTDAAGDTAFVVVADGRTLDVGLEFCRGAAVPTGAGRGDTGDFSPIEADDVYSGSGEEPSREDPPTPPGAAGERAGV